MATFQPGKPLKLYGLSGRKLGDELDRDVATVTVRQAHSGRTGGLSYRLAGDLAFRIELFNDPQDRDRRHGIIGRVSKRNLSGTVRWNPLIESGQSGAWLKYTTIASARPGARGGSSPVLGVTSRRGIDHFYIHRHRRNKLLLNAVSADLADQKSAFSLPDVLGLDESQAVGIATRGQVRFSLRIGWNEILASGMTRLAGLLARPRAVAINLPADLTAQLEFGIKDSFKLVFLGQAGHSTRVALRKSASTNVKAGLDGSIDVRFARASEVARILDDVVAGLLGISPKAFGAAVKALKTRMSLDRLSLVEQELLEGLLEHLGLEHEFSSASEVLEAIDDFQSRVNRELRDIARTRVGTEFAHEYSRVEVDASIYEGEFRHSALEALFQDLLAGRFDAVLDYAERYPRRLKTIRFLNESSLVIRRTTGISLGIGDWSIGGKEIAVFRFITRRNAGRAVRHSLLGSRKYQGRYFGPHETAFAEFRADMRGYAPEDEFIGVKDFRLRLALSYEDYKAWSSQRRLKSFLDMGLVAGIAPAGDLDALTEQIRTTFGRRKTRCRLTLRLSQAALLEFSKWLIGLPPDSLSRLFAGAMDYREGHALLETVHGRRFLYSAFWHEALEHDWDSPYEASLIAMHTFRPRDSSLYWNEKLARRGRGRHPGSMFMLFRRNPGLIGDFQGMRQALARLSEAHRDNSPHEVLAGIARAVHAFANTRLKIRIMGALIAAYIARTGENRSEINSSITVKADNGGDSLTIGR